MHFYSTVLSKIVDHRHSPLFSSGKLKIAIAAVKVIWVSSDEKTGESEVSVNSNGLLTCVCGTMPVSDPRQDTHTTEPNAPR